MGTCQSFPFSHCFIVSYGHCFIVLNALSNIPFFLPPPSLCEALGEKRSGPSCRVFARLPFPFKSLSAVVSACRVVAWQMFRTWGVLIFRTKTWEKPFIIYLKEYIFYASNTKIICALLWNNTEEYMESSGLSLHPPLRIHLCTHLCTVK